MARKSKSTKKTTAKWAVPKMDKKFKCPFCSNLDSVECKFERKLRLAEVYCVVCLARYCTKLNHLTEAIDVYSEWIDECEKANQPLSS